MSGADGSRPRLATALDPLTPAQRKLNMSRIRGRDTKPEMLLRRAMHRAGFRYRLHDRSLPGTPDLVFPGRRAAVFVHGCFWHAHSCPKGVIPATRREFWAEKLAANRRRDDEQVQQLLALGWRVGIAWECALVGRARRETPEIVAEIARWLTGRTDRLEIDGRWSLSESGARE